MPASIVVVLLVAGSAMTGLYLYEGGWARVGVGGMFALAAMTSGGLLGFLFGIPRGLQGNPSGMNTNLEQISDWLTKILVGVALIQLGTIARGAGELFEAVGSALGGGEDAAIPAGALVIFFAIVGFYVAYVIARAELPRAFGVFDNEKISSAAAAKVGEQADRDGEAVRTVMAQLDEHGPAVDPTQLARTLADASPAVLPQAFMLAENQRRTTWRDPAAKARMTRTVPVFRALTEIDPGNHRYWGELGFALKDQTSPDRSAAISALDNAIARRGDAAEHGWELYEFGRALARAGQLGSAPTDDAAAAEAEITRDLAVAMRSDWIRRQVAEGQRRIADRGGAVDYADLEIERLKPFLPKNS